MAFEGVPNETRKSCPDGTTLFERVLPGPDRMYPDTDSAPIPVTDEYIEERRAHIPEPLSGIHARLRDWGIPTSADYYLVSRRLWPLIAQLVEDTGWSGREIGMLLARDLKGVERHLAPGTKLDPQRLADLCRFVHTRGSAPRPSHCCSARPMLPRRNRSASCSPLSLARRSRPTTSSAGFPSSLRNSRLTRSHTNRPPACAGWWGSFANTRLG